MQKNAVKWIKIEIIYNLFVKLLIADFRMPSLLNYVTDVILLLIVFYSYPAIAKSSKKRGFVSLSLTFGLLLFNVLGGLLLNRQSILLFVWGLRNTFRFLLFFYCCVLTLRREDIKSIFRCLVFILYLNVLLCTWQYRSLQGQGGYVKLYLGDFIGGTYGRMQGSNGSLNILFSILLSYYIPAFLMKKVKFKTALPVFISIIYISILAEMKIVMAFMVIILILSLLFNRLQIKTMLLTLVCIGVFYGAFMAWSYYQPGSANIFNKENLLNYTANTGYTERTKLNRLNALALIYNKYLEDDVSNALFGIGLGNADTSQFSMLQSKFYKENSTLAYNYFSHAMLLLETGIFGFASYIALLLNPLFVGLYYKKSIQFLDEDTVYYIAAMNFSMIAVLCLWYNNSLRTESAGYLAFFWLSIPYVWCRCVHSKETEVFDVVDTRREEMFGATVN